MISQSLLQGEFPQDEDVIYLNHAAVTPWRRRTSETVIQFAKENPVTGAAKNKEWLARDALLREQLHSPINASVVDEIALQKKLIKARIPG